MHFVNAHGVSYVPDKFLTYNDVVLLPNYSDIPSRNDSTIKLTARLAKDAEIALPIISSPMDTVTGANMAIALGSVGGLGILHRFYKSKDLWLADINAVVEKFNAVAFSIGAASDDVDLVGEVLKLTPNVLVCIDVANGYTAYAAKQVKTVAYNYPTARIMAGNVCNPEGLALLVEAGAHSVRVGIGGGSACFLGHTLVTTENGLTSIRDIKVGNKVLTHTGRYEEVIFTWEFRDHEELLEIEIDGETITCTPDHKFYCIDSKDQDKVTEENIHDFARWIEARDLDLRVHLLVGNT